MKTLTSRIAFFLSGFSIFSFAVLSEPNEDLMAAFKAGYLNYLKSKGL